MVHPVDLQQPVTNQQMGVDPSGSCQTNTPSFLSCSQAPRGPNALLQREHEFTLEDLHGQDGPGVLQVGDVQVACCVAGQANVEHPEGHNNISDAHKQASDSVHSNALHSLLLYNSNYLNISCNHHLKLSTNNSKSLQRTTRVQRSSEFTSWTQT